MGDPLHQGGTPGANSQSEVQTVFQEGRPWYRIWSIGRRAWGWKHWAREAVHVHLVARGEAVGVDDLAARASEAGTWFISASGLETRRAQGARGCEGTGGARISKVSTHYTEGGGVYS